MQIGFFEPQVGFGSTDNTSRAITGKHCPLEPTYVIVTSGSGASICWLCHISIAGRFIYHGLVHRLLKDGVCNTYPPLAFAFIVLGARGGLAVKVIGYKKEGRGFKTR
jgi:hypothetical protein